MFLGFFARVNVEGNRSCSRTLESIELSRNVVLNGLYATMVKNTDIVSENYGLVQNVFFLVLFYKSFAFKVHSI